MSFFITHITRSFIVIISSIAELPAPLSQHLQTFVEQRPDWTQERILSSALSMFLLQNGVSDRAVSQVYLQAMFGDVFVPARKPGERS
jgi:Protein of unknown function (DUF2811)